MKFFFVVALFLSFGLIGCKKEEPTPPQPAANETPATPDNYLGQITKAEQTMEKKIDTAALNSAVQLFNAQEGRFPKDLNELVEKKYLGKLPVPPFGTKLQYDPADGKVSVVNE